MTPASTRPYHHGDLRGALLAAAEAELGERGLSGFSLRGTAKRAGVSHAAPAHHFANASGLLRALAEDGFDRLAAAMRAAVDAARGTRARFVASGAAYIAFARENPALFDLMFGDPTRAAVADAAPQARDGNTAFEILLDCVAEAAGVEAVETCEHWRAVAAAWGLVHGTAHLLVAGRLTFVASDEIPAMLDMALPTFSRS